MSTKRDVISKSSKSFDNKNLIDSCKNSYQRNVKRNKIQSVYKPDALSESTSGENALKSHCKGDSNTLVSKDIGSVDTKFKDAPSSTMVLRNSTTMDISKSKSTAQKLEMSKSETSPDQKLFNTKTKSSPPTQRQNSKDDISYQRKSPRTKSEIPFTKITKTRGSLNEKTDHLSPLEHQPRSDKKLVTTRKSPITNSEKIPQVTKLERLRVQNPENFPHINSLIEKKDITQTRKPLKGNLHIGLFGEQKSSTSKYEMTSLLVKSEYLRQRKIPETKPKTSPQLTTSLEIAPKVESRTDCSLTGKSGEGMSDTPESMTSELISPNKKVDSLRQRKSPRVQTDSLPPMKALVQKLEAKCTQKSPTGDIVDPEIAQKGKSPTDHSSVRQSDVKILVLRKSPRKKTEDLAYLKPLMTKTEILTRGESSNTKSKISPTRKSPRKKAEILSSWKSSGTLPEISTTQKSPNAMSENLPSQKVQTIKPEISPMKKSLTMIPNEFISKKSPRTKPEISPTRKSPRVVSGIPLKTNRYDNPKPDKNTEKRRNSDLTLIKSPENVLSLESDHSFENKTKCSKDNDLQKQKDGVFSTVKSPKQHEADGHTETKTFDEDIEGYTVNDTSENESKYNVRRKIAFSQKQGRDKRWDENDESDEEYIPRRKKLRSEVTESELWEGLIQNVRFKRLTPKKNSSRPVDVVVKEEPIDPEFDFQSDKADNGIIAEREIKKAYTAVETEENNGDFISVETELKSKLKCVSKESTTNKSHSDNKNNRTKERNNSPTIAPVVSFQNDGINELVELKINRSNDELNTSDATSEENILNCENIQEFGKEFPKIKKKSEIALVVTTATQIVPTLLTDSDNIGNASQISKEVLERNDFVATLNKITPKKRKDAVVDMTPKRSARLQNKSSSNKKRDDNYVYTPLKRHEDDGENALHSSGPLNESKTFHDDKSENCTNDNQNGGNNEEENVPNNNETYSDVKNIVMLNCKDDSERENDNIENGKEVLANINNTKSNVINISTDSPITDNESNKNSDAVSTGSITLGTDSEICAEDMRKESRNKNRQSLVITKSNAINAKEEMSTDNRICTKNISALGTKRTIISTCDSYTSDNKIDKADCSKPSEIMISSAFDGTDKICVNNSFDEEKHNYNKISSSKQNFRMPTCSHDSSSKSAYVTSPLKMSKDEGNSSFDEEVETETSSDDTEKTSTRVPLKIKMKKTRKGATIIYPKPNSSPFVLLPRISLEQCSNVKRSTDTKTKNETSSNKQDCKKEKNKSEKNKSSKTLQVTSNTVKTSKYSANRQLRSSEECDELSLETSLDLGGKTKKSGKIFKQKRKRKSDNRSPLKKTKRRISSPTKDSRSDSARHRNNDVQRLLANKTLEKHACILWSSGHRRHTQMSNPDATHEEIDDIMRETWENMPEKEKIGYFQRAHNALKDEDKHSTPKKPPPKFSNETKMPEIKQSKKMTKFLLLSPNEQHEELQKWLRLFYEISAGEYSKLMREFKELLKIQRSKLKENYKGTFKEKDPDVQSYYRKLLFQKILDARDKIIEIYDQKKERQKLILKETFDSTVRRLIAGEDLEFSKGTRSEALSEVLLDLRDLETDLKIAVSGAPMATQSFENVLDGLQQKEKVESPATDNDGSVEEELKDSDSYYAQQLLNKSSTVELPTLDVGMVDRLLKNESLKTSETFNDELSCEVFQELSTFFDREARLSHERLAAESAASCCELKSPSCTLTNWLLADQFRVLARPVANQLTQNNRMLIDSKQLVQFLKGTGPYNVVALPASTIPPNIRRTGVRRGRPSEVISNRNNNSSILERQHSRQYISQLPTKDGVNTQKASSFQKIVNRRIPSLPGNTVLRYTSTSSGNIRVRAASAI